MAHINLLPYREQRRQRLRNQAIAGLLVGIMLTSVVFLLTNYTLVRRQEVQIARNESLTKKIAFLKSKESLLKESAAQQDALVARLHTLQGLQTNRFLALKFLEGLMGVIPDEVFLSRVVREGDTVFLSGFADSSRAVSELMRRIESHCLSEPPILQEIKKSSKDASADNEFQLSLVLKAKEKECLHHGKA